MRDDIPEIKALLKARAEQLARQLAPEGSRTGNYWSAKNPTRTDRAAGSFVIWIAGPGAGAWKDYAGDCESGGRDTGDVITLIQYCAGLPDLKTTLDWARGWLGLEKMPEVERHRRVAEATAAQSTVEAEHLAKAEKARRGAMAIYVNSKKTAWPGSVAERYLAGRGIRLAVLGRKPGALGFLPTALHSESNSHWPAMVACFTGNDETVVAVHRTFLALDGSGKAPVLPARKIWPSFRGAAIRLWRGDSGLSIAEAAKHGLRETLVITEGVEDALSVAIASPKHRVWAAGALNNIGTLTLPECIDEVIVCADNDWDKPEAQKALQRGLEALARQGVKVRVARSPVGKDVNDALRG